MPEYPSVFNETKNTPNTKTVGTKVSVLKINWIKKLNKKVSTKTKIESKKSLRLSLFFFIPISPILLIF